MSAFELTKRVAQITCSTQMRGESISNSVIIHAMFLTLQVKSGIYLSVTDNWCILYHFFINYAFVHTTYEAIVQLLKWAIHNVHEFRIYMYTCTSKVLLYSNDNVWCSSLLLCNRRIDARISALFPCLADIKGLFKHLLQKLNSLQINYLY